MYNTNKGLNMNYIIQLSGKIGDNFRDISLLLLRLTLAYGFYEPAIGKWADISSIASFFESISIPFPMLNAYMSATTEMLGVILLTLGLSTRLISLPLIVVMIVAIVTVHLGNGFSAGDNGFEIPFYYIIMLLTIFSFGAGRYSLDKIIFKK